MAATKHSAGRVPSKRMARCESEGCVNNARYGAPRRGRVEAIFCKPHAPPDFFDVTHPHTKCAHKSCVKHGTFVLPGRINRDRYCALHAPAGAVHVHGHCQHPDCGKQPSFGEAGTKRLLYCSAHAPDHFVNLRRKRCSIEGCGKAATSAPAAFLPPTHCALHAPGGYVPRSSTKVCVHDGCTKTGSFSVMHESTGKAVLYCRAHAPPGSVNTNWRCGFEGCQTQPSYGSAETGKVEYCAKHASRDHVNLRLASGKACLHAGCPKRPSYCIGIGEKSTYCVEHAPVSYVSESCRKCLHDTCTKAATHTRSPSMRSEYCSQHAPATYIRKGKRSVPSFARSNRGRKPRHPDDVSTSSESEEHSSSRKKRAPLLDVNAPTLAPRAAPL